MQIVCIIIPFAHVWWKIALSLAKICFTAYFVTYSGHDG